MSSLREHQSAFAFDVSRLITFAFDRDMELTFGEAYRTEEQQALYVQKGLSRTMNSWHRKRLAVDLNLFIDGVYLTSAEPYKPLGEYWKSLSAHNKWGGDFPGLGDANHFERRP